MLGIEDPLVALAYFACLGGTVLCVIYGWRNWNRGDDSVQEEDRRWAAEEKQTEENL